VQLAESEFQIKTLVMMENQTSYPLTAMFSMEKKKYHSRKKTTKKKRKTLNMKK